MEIIKKTYLYILKKEKSSAQRDHYDSVYNINLARALIAPRAQKLLLHLDPVLKRGLEKVKGKARQRERERLGVMRVNKKCEALVAAK